MNKVTCKNRNPIYATYIPGDLFVSKEGIVYVLAKIELIATTKYICISLSSGVNWSGVNWDSPKDNIPDAVDGLKFWCRGAEIEVTAPKD